VPVLRESSLPRRAPRSPCRSCLPEPDAARVNRIAFARAEERSSFFYSPKPALEIEFPNSASMTCRSSWLATLASMRAPSRRRQAIPCMHSIESACETFCSPLESCPPLRSRLICAIPCSHRGHGGHAGAGSDRDLASPSSATPSSATMPVGRGVNYSTLAPVAAQSRHSLRTS
jgi:hypothetical protein